MWLLTVWAVKFTLEQYIRLDTGSIFTCLSQLRICLYFTLWSPLISHIDSPVCPSESLELLINMNRIKILLKIQLECQWEQLHFPVLVNLISTQKTWAIDNYSGVKGAFSHTHWMHLFILLPIESQLKWFEFIFQSNQSLVKFAVIFLFNLWCLLIICKLL